MTTTKGRVFISCGQVTQAEKHLGIEVAQLVREQTPFEAYFAENQTELEGVTENILKALFGAVGFIGIMHPRGSVIDVRSEPPKILGCRGSVWIEQEIAIAAFIRQALGRPFPVLAYVHRDVMREGLRDKLHLNPQLFATDEEVLQQLRDALPGWAANLGRQPADNFVGQRIEPQLECRFLERTDGAATYELVLNLENTGTETIHDFEARVEFPQLFYRGQPDNFFLARPECGPIGSLVFGYTATNDNFIPSARRDAAINGIVFTIDDRLIEQNSNLLNSRVSALVHSRGMRPQQVQSTMSALVKQASARQAVANS